MPNFENVSGKRRRGIIKVFSGGMFAGKTDAMINEADRAKYAKETYMFFKPVTDNRYGENVIKSRSRVTTIEATVLPVNGTQEDIDHVLEITKDVDLVGFDEVQFFGDWIVELATILRYRGKKVIMNGLDMTFEGKGFPTTSALMGISDYSLKLHAVCMCCGEEASFSQKLIDGKPAKGGSSVDVEDVSGNSSTTYEARCVNCFVPPEKA